MLRKNHNEFIENKKKKELFNLSTYPYYNYYYKNIIVFL